MSSRIFPTASQFAEVICLTLENRDDQMRHQKLSALFNELPLALLPAFDEWIRQKSYRFPALYQFVSPASLTPEQTPWLFDAPGLVYTLTCHREGRVRSAALLLLAQFNTPLALSLLLVRVNDWVAPVREQATMILREKLPGVPLVHWLDVFPLVARLGRDVRSPAPTLVQEIVRLFLTPEGLKTLMSWYSSLPQDVRRSLSSLLLNQRSLPIPLLLLLAHDPQPVLRVAAVKQLPTSELLPFLFDQNGAVRALALRRLLPVLTTEQATEQVLVAILDPQERVRLLAQYTLRQQGQDVRAVYLQLDPTTLPESQLTGWIAGLASEGQKEDTALIAPFLTHDSARVRLEALHAVGTLDPVAYRFALAAGALDTSPVSRTALRIIKKGGLLNSPAFLEHLFAEASTERLKRRVVRLTLHLERFTAVALLLRWREELTSELSEEIDALLIQLLDGFGRTYYTRPPADLLARLEVVSTCSGPAFRRILAAF